MLKISVVGFGRVGASVVNGLLAHMREPLEINVMDPADWVRGAWLDTAHASAWRRDMALRFNDADAFRKAEIVIYTAGVNPRAGTSRMTVARENIRLTKEIFGGVRWLSQPWVIVVTNPVDLITYHLQRCSGLPPGKVLGTGTLLDTYRLRWYMAEKLGCDPGDVDTWVIGEHGRSMVPLFSNTKIRSRPLAESPEVNAEWLEALLERTRNAAWEVRETAEATRWGVAAATLEMIDAIISGKGELLPASVVPDAESAKELGHAALALSLPLRVHPEGALISWEIMPDPKEWEALRTSAAEIAAHI